MTVESMNKNKNSDAISLYDLLSIIWKRRVLLSLTIALVMVITALTNFRMEKIFRYRFFIQQAPLSVEEFNIHNFFLLPANQIIDLIKTENIRRFGIDIEPIKSLTAIDRGANTIEVVVDTTDIANIGQLRKNMVHYLNRCDPVIQKRDKLISEQRENHKQKIRQSKRELREGELKVIQQKIDILELKIEIMSEKDAYENKWKELQKTTADREDKNNHSIHDPSKKKDLFDDDIQDAFDINSEENLLRYKKQLLAYKSDRYRLELQALRELQSLNDQQVQQGVKEDDSILSKKVKAFTFFNATKEAILSDEPIRPKTSKNIALSGILSLLIGTILVTIQEVIKRR